MHARGRGNMAEAVAIWREGEGKREGGEAEEESGKREGGERKEGGRRMERGGEESGKREG